MPNKPKRSSKKSKWNLFRPTEWSTIMKGKWKNRKRSCSFWRELLMRMLGRWPKESWRRDLSSRRLLSFLEIKAFSSKANSKKPTTKTPSSHSHSKNCKKSTTYSKKPTSNPNENPKSPQTPTNQQTSTTSTTSHSTNKNKKWPPSTKPASKAPTTN